jgi:hypothetical protein
MRAAVTVRTGRVDLREERRYVQDDELLREERFVRQFPILPLPLRRWTLLRNGSLAIGGALNEYTSDAPEPARAGFSHYLPPKGALELP